MSSNEGSPARALKVNSTVRRFYLYRPECRQNRISPASNAPTEATSNIFTGDCKRAFDLRCPAEDSDTSFTPGLLCLLDPYGMHLDWQVIQMAGRSRAIDMFLTFQSWTSTERVSLEILRRKASSKIIERMNRFWGDESWRNIAYVESGQYNLLGDPPRPLKQDNETIAEAFRERLREVAGFAYVPEPSPMKNRNNAILYYLFFAAANKTADKIIRDIFAKYRA